MAMSGPGAQAAADPHAALMGTASEVAARLEMAAAAGNVPGTVDVFAQKLTQILAADFTGIAMQTPLDLSAPQLSLLLAPVLLSAAHLPFQHAMKYCIMLMQDSAPGLYAFRHLRCIALPLHSHHWTLACKPSSGMADQSCSTSIHRHQPG